jgi:hypothetical protein
MTDVSTPEGRRELKALAEKATPGPWKADGTIYEHMVSEIRSIMPGEERGIAQVWQHPQGFADARFIAAANPATVLSLLAALEEAREREAGLIEQVASLKKAAHCALDYIEEHEADAGEPMWVGDELRAALTTKSGEASDAS